MIKRIKEISICAIDESTIIPVCITVYFIYSVYDEAYGLYSD